MIAATVLAALTCAPVIFAPAGVWHPDRVRNGPALVLSGGGLMQMPYDDVLRWMRARIVAPPARRAGNLLIIKASGARDYSDLFYTRSLFGSVQEILIPPCASSRAVSGIARYVDRADAVLFSGGDQAHYVAWKGTALPAAVKRLYARGGIVGGGSAGLAIQGALVFDSAAADRVLPADEDVATPDAVANPYEPSISFTRNLFSWPALASSMTDTHFARRNRFGRTVAFLARALRDGLISGNPIYGIGVDEAAALLVDKSGVATLVERPKESSGYVPQGAYIVRAYRNGGVAVPGRPLRFSVDVTHINRAGMRYNLLTHSGQGVRYQVRVDGSRTRMYSRSPYSY